MKKILTFILALCCVAATYAQRGATSVFSTNLPTTVELPTLANYTLEVALNTADLPVAVLNQTTITYTWQTQNAGTSVWMDITSSTRIPITSTKTRSTIKFTAAMTLSAAMGKIRCKVDATYGGNTNTEYSNVCTFVATPSVTSQPENVFYDDDDAYGDNEVSFSVAADAKGGTLTYQWYDASNNTAISGATDQNFAYYISDGIDSVYCKIHSSRSTKTVTTKTARTIFWYDLYVLGNRVTELNYNDILGDGTVSFLNDTLYLNNVNYTDPDMVGGDVSFAHALYNLNVRCIGNNTLHLGYDAHGFELDGTYAFSLTGDRLFIDHGDSDGLRVNSQAESGVAYMYIKNMENLTIACRGGGDAIGGLYNMATGDCNAKLFIENSTIYATNITYFGEINLAAGMGIQFYLTDTEGIHDQGQGHVGNFTNWQGKPYQAIANSNGTEYRGYYVAEDDNEFLVITPVTTYPIKVAGVQVTNLNQDDILGDGTVYYDDFAETLFLEDATINAPASASAIEFAITEGDHSYTISCSGTNTLTASSDTYGAITLAIMKSDPASLNITIQGDTLIANGTGTTGFGLGVLQRFPNISSCGVLLRGLKYGQFEGNGENNGIVDFTLDAELTIQNSMIVSEGISGFASCQLGDNLLVNESADYTYENRKFKDQSGNAITGTITIRPAEVYFTMSGNEINEINHEDVRGDGTISYDPGTNTLVLTNYVGASAIGLQYGNKTQELYIECHGKNQITSVLGGAIYAPEATSIIILGETEEDELEIVANGKTTAGPAISAGKADLLVTKATLKCTATRSDCNNTLVNVKSFEADYAHIILDATKNSEAVVVNTDVTLNNASIKEGAYNENYMEIVPEEGTALSNTNADVTVQKVVRDGQVVILRNGKAYSVLGIAL